MRVPARSRVRSGAGSPTGALTLRDRFVLGGVAAVLGALAGLLAVAALAWASDWRLGAWNVVPASALYFCVVTAVVGPDAGFVLGDAMTAATEANLDPLMGVGHEGPARPIGGGRGSAWFLGGWLLLVAVLAWR